MAVIQGSSAYSTKAELIPGIWRGFSAVQLLPVLSAGLGCSFGQGGENGGFYCLFPVAPSSLCPLSPLSHMLQPCLPAVCLPLCYGLQCRACGCLSLCRSGAASLWLLLAVSPVPRLWRWRSSLWLCFSPSSLCYGSALRGLLSSVLSLRLLSVRLLAVAVCPSLCLAVMISAACAVCPLSVLPSLAAGWPYVQANSVWSICTKTPLQIWLLFKAKAGKF